MCLILFSYNNHPDYKLILASNRDEFFNRPSLSLSLWDNSESILAGRDLKDGGTWLGVSKGGKFAAITNFRDPKTLKTDAPSRGILVSEYLKGKKSPGDYLEEKMTRRNEYNGFNFLAGDETDLFYYSNAGGSLKKLDSGLYGLSNRFLDTPWPKVVKGKEGLKEIISEKDFSQESIFSLLADSNCPPDSDLPDTGIGIEWERLLGSLFISSETYGTRCSTILTIDYNSRINVVERTFSKKGEILKQSEESFTDKS